MSAEQHHELKVGAFIAMGLGLTLLAIWLIGSTQNLFARRDPYFIVVKDAGGISQGAKVTISGLNAGSVESFSLSRDGSVRVNLSVSKRFEGSIRQDSIADVSTEGVLGDKLIAIAAGSEASPALSLGSEIPTRKESSIQSLLHQGGRLATEIGVLVRDLDHLSVEVRRQVKNGHLSGSLQKIDSILGKIDQGNGTLGGLVNDPKLYDDVKAIIGEGNDNRIVRNIVRNSVKSAEPHP